MDPSMLKQIALGTVPPGLAGLAVLMLWWWRGRGANRAGALAFGAAALGVAFIPIAALVLGKFAWKPTSASQWVPWFGLMSGAAAFVATRWSASRAAIWIARLVAVALVGWLSVRSQAGAWGAEKVAVTLGVFVGLSALALWAIDRSLARRCVADVAARTSLVSSLVTMVMLGGVAQVLVLAFFSLALAQTAGILAALLGGVFVGSLWKRDVALCPGVFDAPVVLGMAMLFHGCLFGDSEHPWLFVGLIVASPLAAAVARRALPLDWQGWKRAVIEVAAALTPVAVAVGLALAQRPPE